MIRRVFCKRRVSNGLQESQWVSTHGHSLLRAINASRWVTGRSLRAISSRTKYFRVQVRELGSIERHNKRQSKVKGNALILRPIGQRISYRYMQVGSGMASVRAVLLGGEPEVARIDFWLYSVKFFGNSRRVGGLGRPWLA